MRQLRLSNEAEMIALFLRTELGAARFQADLRALLEHAGLPERIVTDPDIDNAALALKGQSSSPAATAGRAHPLLSGQSAPCDRHHGRARYGA
jgi:hypothetical protein